MVLKELSCLEDRVPTNRNTPPRYSQLTAPQKILRGHPTRGKSIWRNPESTPQYNDSRTKRVEVK